MENQSVKAYTAKNGNTMYKPSIELCQEMEHNCEGFCLACGEVQSGVEPDAARYTCECCDENKVFGPMTLARMGLVF